MAVVKASTASCGTNCSTVKSSAASRKPRYSRQWRNYYNTVRPHSLLGYRPPAPQTFMPQSSHPDGTPAMQSIIVAQRIWGTVVGNGDIRNNGCSHYRAHTTHICKS